MSLMACSADIGSSCTSEMHPDLFDCDCHRQPWIHENVHHQWFVTVTAVDAGLVVLANDLMIYVKFY